MNIKRVKIASLAFRSTELNCYAFAIVFDIWGQSKNRNVLLDVFKSFYSDPKYFNKGKHKWTLRNTPMKS